MAIFELPPDFQWLAPWSPVSPEDGPGIVEELRREISVGHVLAECEVMAIGESDNYDDYLFGTNCPSKPLALVHLTWKVESNPEWPFTAVYASLDDWIDAMVHDHADFSRRFTAED